MPVRELRLDIRSTDDDRILVRASSDEDGYTPEHTFPRPFEAWECEAMLASGKRDEGQREPPKPHEAGQRLFEAVFGGEVRDHWLRLRGRLDDAASRGEQAGVRLRLRFDLGDEHRAYLASLPWELLRDPVGGFLADRRSTPLVRDVVRHLGPARPRLEVEGALKILLVAAGPEDHGPIHEEATLMALKVALGKGSPATLMTLARPTLSMLRNALLDEEIHVLHFLGHGAYHEGLGHGALIFERGARESHEVDAEDFAAILTDVPSLRLVVLMACEGARYGGSPGSPYYGVAARLLERPGMPAVLAAQHRITTAVAAEIAGRLYRRLLKGDPLDVAVNETRLGLRTGSGGWHSPVLFLSAADSSLLQAAGSTDRPQTVTIVKGVGDQPRPELEPLHVGLLSFAGEGGVAYGGPMEAECDRFLDLRRHFDPESRHGRLILDPALWQHAIYPELRTFFGSVLEEQATAPGRPILVDFAAHASIAFAAGYVLESKSSLDIRVRQRMGEAVLDWAPDEGDLPETPSLWREGAEVVREDAGPDLALAMSVSNEGVAEHVKTFVDKKDLPIGRIRDLSILPKPDQRGVLSGRHARKLAQALVPMARVRRPGERRGRVHLFWSGPNAFAFYLGQLGPAMGDLATYEFAFGMKDSFGRYQKSFELPPPDDPGSELGEGW